MSTASGDSSTEISLGPLSLGDPADSDEAQIVEGAIWLDGGVLACACPECGAPMSIRLWLMVADCFRCGASIELTEQQEREALRLLRRYEEARQADSQAAAAAISPTVLRGPAPARETRPVPEGPAAPRDLPSEPVPATAPPRQRPRRVAAAEVHRGARAHIRNLYEKGGTAVLFGNLLKDLPAWLVSLVVHLVAILLLGLWYDEPSEDSPSITLATSISYEDLEGGQDMDDQTPEAFEFEDPGAVEMLGDVEVAGAPSGHVDLESMEVPIDVPYPVGRLPSALTRSTTPLPPAPMGRMFAGRDPQARARAVEHSGGTSFTEAAVARGLKFLARHQNSDGSWSLEKFHRSPDCDRTCTGAGQMRNDVAATALALLPFLGAGQTHEEGAYAAEVFRGLDWLIRQQEEDGDLRGEGPRISQMYAHAQAAIVLCEAYAMTGDEQLRESAQMALNFIMHAQSTRGEWPGGWRYEPGESGDTSVLGWQLMALKSGQMSYLQVPPRTFEMAGYYLDRAQTDRIGGRYGYQPGHQPTEAMTAEALLCRQYLGWPKDRPGLKSGVQYLLREHPPNRKRPNIYYWYYATQVMRHFGGEPWERWNAKMRETLVAMQEKRGHAAGSWTPRGQGNSSGHAETGGRIYMTSLAVCILEVYYRHMPLYGDDVLEGAQ